MPRSSQQSNAKKVDFFSEKVFINDIINKISLLVVINIFVKLPKPNPLKLTFALNSIINFMRGNILFHRRKSDKTRFICSRHMVRKIIAGNRNKRTQHRVV